MEYGILLTNVARLDIISLGNKEDRKKLINFSKYLFNGDWLQLPFKQKYPNVWKDPKLDNYLFSFQLNDELNLIWVPIRTINLSDFFNKIRDFDCKPRDFESDFLIIYSIKAILGVPEKQIFLFGKEPFYKYDFNSPSIGEFLETRVKGKELSYNEELYVLGKHTFEEFILGYKEGLPLHMTPEQAEILAYQVRQPEQPLLLSGEAGSGKTIVMTHWLALNRISGENPNQLFVTFSQLLVEKTKTEFEQMIGPKYISNHNVDFLTYRELLWEEIANIGGLRPFEEINEMTFERYMRECSNKIAPNLDPILVWDEVRSVIKGIVTEDEQSQLISLDEYKRLNDERGQCKVPDSLREDYYNAAESYQKYLNENNLWDSMDLAKFCVKTLKSQKGNHLLYDKIACDEIQDLSPVEIHLLLFLLKNGNIGNMFITGDTAQVINPSGFTWKRLKGLIGKTMNRTGIPDAHALHRNFRCSKEIVNLVNKNLMIREEILQDFGEKNKQISYKETGFLPMLLKENPLEILKQEISNPQTRMILVKTKAEKEKLEKIFKEAWPTRRATILTIEEAKGLEWKVVLLYNFFIPRHESISRNDWEDVFIPTKRQALPELYLRGKRHKYALSYEFNLLHVALTRARDILFIYDEHETFNLLNFNPDFKDLVNTIGIETFQKTWGTNPPSASEFEELARRLKEKDLRQAIIFFMEAASAWQKCENYYHAAMCWEEAREYARAAECHRLGGRKSKHLEMRAKHFNNQKDYEQEGEIWKQYILYHSTEEKDSNKILKGFERAKKAFLKAEKSEKAAIVVEEKAEYFKDDLKRLSALGEAAIIWEAAGKKHKSGELLLSIYKKKDIIKKYEGEYIDQQKIEKWFAKKIEDLASLYLKEGNLREASSKIMESARIWSSLAKKSDEEKEKLEALEKHKEAIKQASRWLVKLGDYDLALNYLTDLLEKLKKVGVVDLCVDCYFDIIEIAKINKEIHEVELLADEAYTFYLQNDKSPDNLLLNLKAWYHENKALEAEYRILLKLIDRYQRKNPDLDILYSKEAIEIANELDFYEDAVKMSLDLGLTYLSNQKQDDANQQFERGLKILEDNDVGPINLGWYCFNRVAIDKYIIPDVTWNCYKSKFSLNQMLYWIEKSLKYFTKNPRKARMKLNKFRQRNVGYRSVWGEYTLVRLNTMLLELDSVKDPQHIKEIITIYNNVHKDLKNRFIYQSFQNPFILADINAEIEKLEAQLPNNREDKS